MNPLLIVGIFLLSAKPLGSLQAPGAKGSGQPFNPVTGVGEKLLVFIGQGRIFTGLYLNFTRSYQTLFTRAPAVIFSTGCMALAKSGLVLH
jgi:hypothetical protein